MAINKKLIHFKKKENFDTEVANGNILDTSIVFIKDVQQIYTHGTFYSGSTFDSSEIENKIDNIDKKVYVWNMDLNAESGTVTKEEYDAIVAADIINLSGALTVNTKLIVKNSVILAFATPEVVCTYHIQEDLDWNRSQESLLINNGDGTAFLADDGEYKTLSTVATSGSYEDLSHKPDIPSETTVSGWGFTKNTGTYSKPSAGIPKTDLTDAVQASLNKADSALQSYTETDPVFIASPAAGITSSDITNWNSKTSNTGTMSGVIMNGTTKSPNSNGIVDLGTVITAHQDISGKLDATTAASTYATKTELNSILTSAKDYTDGVIETLVGAAPDTLDTIHELASAVSDNQEIIDNIESAITNKVDKVTGKGLSTNDYTTAEKNKLSGIAAGAEVNVQSDWNITDTTSDAYIKNKPSFATVATSGSYNDLSNKPTIPTNTNQLTNGAGFITGINKSMVTTALGYTPPTTDTNTHYTTRLYAGASGTAANAAATSPYIKITDDNTYRNQIRLVGGGATTVTSDANGNITISSTDNNTTYSAATTSADGLMTAAMVTKLNGIATGATAVSSTTVSNWGFTKNTGTVTSVKIGSTSYSPSSGVVSLPAYPTSLPASDVSSWAKATSKPTYTKAEVGLGNVDNTADSDKSVKYATSSGTCTGNAATATNASKVNGLSISKVTAMPSSPDANTIYFVV